MIYALKPDPFGTQLDWLIAPLMDEFSQKTHLKTAGASEAGFIRYLQAVHGALLETYGFINWELLETNGLTHIEDHRAAVTKLATDLRNLSAEPSIISKSGNPSITPTYGVSIGMLFSLSEGTRAAQRTSSKAICAGPDELALMFQSNQLPSAHQNVVRDSLVGWVNGLSLSEGEMDEALFAAKACVEFARRHFSEKTDRV